MRFRDRLNDYISDIGCTAKELSDASGVSTAVISRYRSGERAPQENSEQLRLLAEGIALLEAQKNGKHLDPDAVYREFVLSITGITVSYSTFLSNLHALLAVLQITNNGTSYRNIVLEDFVQEKAKLPDDAEIAFYHVKTLNRNLFITGGYRYTDGEGDPRCQYFFLRAKTDKNLTFHKLGKNLTGDDFARWSNPAEFSWDL